MVLAAARSGLRKQVLTAVGVSFVQGKTSSNGTPSATQTVTLDSAVQAGDVVVINVEEYPKATTVTGISGLGATWTRYQRQVGTSGFSFAHSVWVGVGVVAGGTTITLTSSASNHTNDVVALVYRGIPYPQVVNSATTYRDVTTPLDSGALTPAVGSKLVVGFIFSNNTPTILWADNPSPNWVQPATSLAYAYPAHKINPTAGVSHQHYGTGNINSQNTGCIVELAAALYADSYNRANATDLGTDYSDQVNFSVKNNQAWIDNSVVVGVGYGVRDVGVADVRVSAKLVSDLTISGTQVGVILRYQDANNYLYFDGRSGGGQFLKRVAGSPTVLATSSSAFANGDTVTIAAVGSSFTMLKNGVSVATWTDSTFQTLTKHGLRGNATGFAPVILDDLVISAA